MHLPTDDPRVNGPGWFRLDNGQYQRWDRNDEGEMEGYEVLDSLEEAEDRELVVLDYTPHSTGYRHKTHHIEVCLQSNGIVLRYLNGQRESCYSTGEWKNAGEAKAAARQKVRRGQVLARR